MLLRMFFISTVLNNGESPVEKRYVFCIVINMAAVMVQSVADNQIINFQDHVIPGYLIKYCLRDFYMWSFVFHNQFGT